MTSKRKLPRSPNDLRTVGKTELYDFAMGLLTALRLFTKDADDLDSKRLKRAVEAFRKFADWSQVEYTRFSNEKNSQLIPFLLREKHQISPGALLSTIAKTQFMDKDATKKVLEVEPNVILLYLGVATDENYNTIALKMLVENKVLYYHKREGLPWFVDNITKHFKVVQKAKIDKRG